MAIFNRRDKEMVWGNEDTWNNWEGVDESESAKGINERLVEQFLSSDDACISCDLGDPRLAQSKRNSIAHTITMNNKYKGKVVAMKRGSRVYLKKV